VPEGVATVSWAAQARRLAAGLAVLPGDAELHRLAAAVLADLSGRDFVPSPCHHDLHHLNVLDDGERLWLVDWEYGGRGDPLMDIAGFLALHGLGPSATDTFLAAYGRLRPADRERLDAARWAFDYVQWLWYRRRDPDGAGEAGARAQGLARRLLHCDNRPIARDHG
jgi:thiamine kinase-like enzyme